MIVGENVGENDLVSDGWLLDFLHFTTAVADDWTLGFSSLLLLTR